MSTDYYLRPSGGIVAPCSAPTLNGIPTQPAPTEPVPYELTDQALHALADQPATRPAPESLPLVDVVTDALTAVGVDAGAIAEARQVMAAGQTYLAFAQAVRDHDNEDLLPVVDSLAAIIERVASHQPLKPLVDAIERFKAAEFDRNWMSLRADDVKTMPLPNLLDAFGAVVVEVDEIERGEPAILHQEDEQLEMHVLRTLTRKQRESAIRGVFLKFAGLNR